MKKVKRRAVFYIPGFDPRRPSYYYNLYKSESNKQSKINGLDFDIGELEKIDDSCFKWSIDSTDKSSGDQTHTDYHFLYWGDIVKKYWFKSTYEILWALCFLLSNIISVIIVAKEVYCKQKRMIVPYIGPILMIILSFSILPIFWFITLKILPVNSEFVWIFIASILVFMISSIVIKILLLQYSKYNLLWLFRLYVFILKFSLNNQVLESKSYDMANRIFRTLIEQDFDEILIVAHSAGTIVSVDVIHRVLELLAQNNYDKKLTLITLGQCIPTVSFNPHAHFFRNSLKSLGSNLQLSWVDYSAPSDGACFSLIDPIKASGITETSEANPVLKSPRFHTLYDKTKYSKMNFYNKHFLYLMSTDYAGGYDYFKITAGNELLRDTI